MKRIKSLFLCLLVVITTVIVIDISMDFVGEVQAATLYVNETGSGGAYDKIQDAINNSNPGDTVFVYSGIYYENIVIDKKINLTGENKETTTIDGGGIGDVIYISGEYVNLTGFSIINGNDTGVIIDADYVNITGNTIKNNYKTGLTSYYSSWNIINNNLISDNNNWGVYTMYSPHNYIQNNTIINNDYGGVCIDNSVDNHLYSNIISLNRRGVLILYSDYCFIRGNNISENSLDGISISNYANYNTINENTLWKNYLYGIYLKDSQDNSIYHNNFIDNGNQSLETGDKINYWDKGYPIGGNFWSDYNGYDLYSGSGQNVIGSDGIGDSDYMVEGSTYDDEYPLIEQYQGELPSDRKKPLISSISVIDLSFTYAKIKWHSDEYSTSRVNVSKQADMSSNRSENSSSLVRWHNIDLMELEPNTTFYFQVSSSDPSGNIAIDNNGSNYYSFKTLAVESIPPAISLINLSNNSVIRLGTIVVLNITDTNLSAVTCSINNGIPQMLEFPFEINTTGWLESVYKITIYANDTLGNNATKFYTFTIDSTPPMLVYDTSINLTTIPSGTRIPFDISDAHLDNVKYSLNGGEYNVLQTPYELNTSNWTEGLYTVIVIANDSAGNEVMAWFRLWVDAISPFVLSSSPLNNSREIDTRTDVVIVFNEPMNQTDTESHLTIQPSTEMAYQWDVTGKVLTISFVSDSLFRETTYDILIDSGITDVNGNNMISDFKLVFSTMLLDTDGDLILDNEDEDDDNDGYPDEDDAFPLNNSEWIDTDNDGMGNNEDVDDDGDGIYDNSDPNPLEPKVWGEEEEVPPSDNTGILALVIAIIVMVLLILFFILRKIQGEGKESTPKEIPEPEDREPEEEEVSFEAIGPSDETTTEKPEEEVTFEGFEDEGKDSREEGSFVGFGLEEKDAEEEVTFEEIAEEEEQPEEDEEVTFEELEGEKQEPDDKTDSKEEIASEDESEESSLDE